MTHALTPTSDAVLSTHRPAISDPRLLSPPVVLHAGLTLVDAARISAAISAGRADSTRAVYAYAWRRWERWCVTRAIIPEPATPAAVCAYLTEFAERGVTASTIEVACAAIADRHRSRGLDNPIAHEAVRQVRRGLRRTIGTAPRRQARPLSTDDIRQILTHIDRTTPKGIRDAALILLGFASALRRSELAALTLDDVEAKPAGLLVLVRRSKSDPERRGEVVGVAHGQHPHTDPVAALNAWITLRGTDPGPLFTNAHNGRVGSRPITGSGLTKMLKDRADSAGLPSERITGHSLRAGHATTAAMAGVGLDRIAAQTRHSRISTLIEHYIRPVEALHVTSSRDLGL